MMMSGTMMMKKDRNICLAAVYFFKRTNMDNVNNGITSYAPQAAIVAVSTCHDVFETLEKRVQSRFVHSKLGVDWYSYSQEPGLHGTHTHTHTHTHKCPPWNVFQMAFQTGECVGDLLKSMLCVPEGVGADAHNRAVAAAVGSPSAKEALRKLSLHCTSCMFV